MTQQLLEHADAAQTEHDATPDLAVAFARDRDRDRDRDRG